MSISQLWPDRLACSGLVGLVGFVKIHCAVFQTSAFLEETELGNAGLCGVLNGTVGNTNHFLGISIYADFSIFFSCVLVSCLLSQSLDFLMFVCGIFCFIPDCSQESYPVISLPIGLMAQILQLLPPLTVKRKAG